MSDDQTQTQSTATEPTSSPEKDPKDWVTGDEPATGAQISYLTTLAQDADTEVPTELTKAHASELIDELQEKSPRVDDPS